MIKARNIPAVLLALIIGFVAEAVLGVISVVSAFARIGPCGSAGDPVPGFVRAIHRPGFWIAGALVEDSSPRFFPLAVFITTVFLSVLAFCFLWLAADRKKYLLSKVTSEKPSGRADVDSSAGDC
jgi:hypothetical protein